MAITCFHNRDRTITCCSLITFSVRQSGAGSPQSQRPAELSDDEVGELFQRLAEVQQEKWMLEEKVR